MSNKFYNDVYVITVEASIDERPIQTLYASSMPMLGLDDNCDSAPMWVRTIERAKFFSCHYDNRYDGIATFDNMAVRQAIEWFSDNKNILLGDRYIDFEKAIGKSIESIKINKNTVCIERIETKLVANMNHFIKI